MRSRILGLVAASTLLGISGSAHAIPTLQLGIVGGTYDAATQTVIAPGDTFQLVAILTPGNGANVDLAAMLGMDYYVSAALLPKTIPPGGDFGSFDFGGATIAATGGMVYGTPPLDAVLAGQPGDLQDHGIFETYFTEFGFKFDDQHTLSGCSPLDVQTNAGLSGCSLGGTGGTQYYHTFNVDVSALETLLHFDLYNQTVKCLGTGDPKPPCTGDEVASVDDFAPFSHDAQSSSTSSSGTSSSGSDVPEPGTLTLLGLGLLGLGYARRSKKAA